MRGGWKPKDDREVQAYKDELCTKYGGFMCLADITKETGYKKQKIIKEWLREQGVPAYCFGSGNVKPRLRWKTADVAATIEKSKMVAW